MESTTDFFPQKVFNLGSKHACNFKSAVHFDFEIAIVITP